MLLSGTLAEEEEEEVKMQAVVVKFKHIGDKYSG